MEKENLISRGVIMIILAVLIPIFFWYPLANFLTIRSTLLSLGQIASLAGYVLLTINFILSARLKFVYNLFGGLGRMYKIHHLTGVVSFTLLLIHPTLIITSYALTSVRLAFESIMPSWSNLPITLGMAALGIMILLILVTIFIKIEYGKWKLSHKFLGITLLLSSVHVLMIGSTVGQSLGLKIYVIFFMTSGIICFFYYSLWRSNFLRK